MTDRETGVESKRLGPKNQSLAILLISILGLFLEMMLIRWIGTEIRIFAYLQNTVLIVCFLGLGMGCFTCRQPIRIRRMLQPLLALTLLLAIPLTHTGLGRITEMLSGLTDLLIWEHAVKTSQWQGILNVSKGLALTMILMIVVWEMFVPIGRLLGRYLDDHPRTIWAYSVNVAGSLLGIWLFVLLSALYSSPVIWMLVTGLLLIPFLGGGRERLTNMSLLAVTLVAAWFAGMETNALEVIWSPYQKLVLEADSEEWPGDYLIRVNNAGYQGLIGLDEEHLRKNKQIPEEMWGLSQYDIPFRICRAPANVLIVGAGSGNDAAGALRGNAKRVTAVEIDPAIIQLGKRFHPERPYDSALVQVVNDDARSFFATTDQKFDLIIFGLLDSHTTTSMTNARLDHYVYTRESIERARSLLDDRGVMVLTFAAIEPYISDRMNRCIHEVFGKAPLCFNIPFSASGWGGVMFVAGDQRRIHDSLSNDDRLSDQIRFWQEKYPVELSGTTSVASDDWPYIYLKDRRIPALYFLLAGMMVTLTLYTKRRLGLSGALRGWKRTQWHFFFLGAAFLLLEVQNISKASVVLGSTWLVNAVIISGILLMILAANVIATRFPRLSVNVCACLLIGSCVALYFVDLSRLGFLPFPAKALAVGLLTTLPIFFSGVIFIRSFAATERKDAALGANLIGALVGGLLQSVTFVTGVGALLLVVAALYVVALATRPKKMETSTYDWEDARDSESKHREAAEEAKSLPAPVHDVEHDVEPPPSVDAKQLV